MATARDLLDGLLRERVLVLDGAMGTILQQLSPGGGNHDVLNLTHPELVSKVHDDYLDAGCDIIETNTFNGTSIAQADYGTSARAYEVNVTAARLARLAADAWTTRTPLRPRFVAGSMGPTRRRLSTDRGRPPVTFEDLREAYGEQVRGLLDGGCDLLLVETIVDIRNAQAALAAIDDVSAGHARGTLPVMLSISVDGRDGHLLSGQRVDEFRTTIAPARPFSLGVNCSCEAGSVTRTMAGLAQDAAWTTCHPSAGLPDESGRYPVRPDEAAALLGSLAARGLVNIVGGCCGTTPAHIRAIAGAVAGIRPRLAPATAKR